MSLFKQQARRVAVVGVGVGLLVLGLEAPAFAAAPVISSFTPDSGDDAGGCIVVVTGTGLDDFADDVWTFLPPTGTGTTAPDAVLASDTEAWVTMPSGLTAGTSYNIKITNSGGTSTSTGTFLVTTGAGNCAPTITKLTPACGSSNTKVVITGTNLLRDPTPTAAGEDIVGGLVSFTPFTTNAAVVPPDSDTSTTLTRFVSADAKDGPVRVTAGGGIGFSTESFQVPPPDCAAAQSGGGTWKDSVLNPIPPPAVTLTGPSLASAETNRVSVVEVSLSGGTTAAFVVNGVNETRPPTMSSPAAVGVGSRSRFVPVITTLVLDDPQAGVSFVIVGAQFPAPVVTRNVPVLVLVPPEFVILML